MFKSLFDRFKIIRELFSPGEAHAAPKKARRPEFYRGDRIIGKRDPRAPLNFAVLMERQSFDGRTNWLVGYNLKHHPQGIENWKGLTYYRVRETK